MCQLHLAWEFTSEYQLLRLLAGGEGLSVDHVLLTVQGNG